MNPLLFSFFLLNLFFAPFNPDPHNCLNRHEIDSMVSALEKSSRSYKTVKTELTLDCENTRFLGYLKKNEIKKIHVYEPCEGFFFQWTQYYHNGQLVYQIRESGNPEMEITLLDHTWFCDGKIIAYQNTAGSVLSETEKDEIAYFSKVNGEIFTDKIKSAIRR